MTVSRVLNRVGNVNPATQQRVEQAIEELGYVPSGVAKSLRSKRTNSLALILPDIQNAFWTTVARGVEDAAQSHGYSVFLCNTDENPAKQLRYLDVVVSQRVDGVMIAPFGSDADDLARLRTRDVPTVVIDRQINGWDVDSVIGDSLSGARALVSHLVSLGHRRIAVLAGPEGTATATDRVTGYRIALAEAGIAEDARLIRFGEFKALSGEHMMAQVLDSGAEPTAVFAANNVIAMGVLDELEHRGLRVPQDLALVCFDDLPNTSRLFPFLTVAVQPAYEIGANAAQLLLSRLEAKVPLQPRHVVLPTRLIVRYSCGSKLQRGKSPTLSLPLPAVPEPSNVLVPKVDPALMRLAPAELTNNHHAQPRRALAPSESDRSDVNRLLKVLRHQEADRVPHLEFWIDNRPILEYVLEHKLDQQPDNGREAVLAVSPEDHVEFAQRLGMDAVTCHFSWRPNNVFASAADGSKHYIGGSVRNWTDLENLEPPPPLAQQLNTLERMVRAAQGSGVGVVASFTSFFDSALLAIGVADALLLFYDNRPFLEKLMDIVLDHQQRVMQAVCDRFSDELAFVLVSDDIAHQTGLMIDPRMFEETVAPRMMRLITPAKEYGKLVALHTEGRIDQALPMLHDIGIDILHPVAPECNDIEALRRQWAGRVAFAGNIPALLLAYGHPDEIEERVRQQCAAAAAGGGYVLGTAPRITEGIRPENFVAMIQAAHRFGRYDHLGRADAAEDALRQPAMPG
ncbi:MAG: substrate-binding domain-containing protein [Anaerolineae bacterium]|nr:substrate-binding domain-containing protein [Anaerolineae bacterium]